MHLYKYLPRSRINKNYDNSHPDIIGRARQYFHEERRREQSYNLNKVVQRTAAVTELSARTINRSKTEDDLSNRQYDTK